MPDAPPRPRWIGIAIAVLHFLQLLSLLPWLPMAGLAIMAFDAPGSTEKWQPWAFVLTIWSYPLWLIAAAAAAWTLFAFGRRRIALGLATIFSLPALGFLAWFGFLAILSRQ